MNLNPLEARSHYNRLITQNPKDPGGYLGLGDLAFSGHFYDDAVSYYHQAVALDPKILGGWLGLARTYLYYQSFEEAYRCVHKVLEIDSNHEEALLLGAIMCNKLHRYIEGGQYLKTASEDTTSQFYVISQFLYGYNECSLGNFNHGIDLFENCINRPPFDDKSDPNFAALFNDIGVAYLKIGKYPEAEAAFQTLIEAAPSIPASIWLNYAIILWAQDKIEESLSTLSRVNSLEAKLWPWLRETKEYTQHGSDWLQEAVSGLKTHTPLYDVSLYLGCVIPNRYPFIEAATRHILNGLDIGVANLEGASCCPAPGVFRSFDIETWLALGARNIIKSEAMERDLLTMCNGCYGTLNDVNTELKKDPAKKDRVNQVLREVDREFKGTIQVRHILDVLLNEIGLDTLKQKITRKLSLRVAVHYGCHIIKPMHNKPWLENWEGSRFFDDLVEITGATSVDYKDKMMCCGAGGGVRGALKDVSLSFTLKKLNNMSDAGVDAIVVCCPFCHLQFDIGQVEINKSYRDQIKEPFHIPVIYITQLLGWAMGYDPFRMGLLKTPQKPGIPPMIPFEPLFTRFFQFDHQNSALFSPHHQSP